MILFYGLLFYSYYYSAAIMVQIVVVDADVAELLVAQKLNFRKRKLYLT